MRNLLREGINDLESQHPDLALEWSVDNELPANKVTRASAIIGIWVCPRGHRYEMAVNDRTSHGYGCPYCSGHRPIKGETDLQTLYPHLAKEWLPENELRPDEVMPSSGTQVLWKCPNNHIYKASVDCRTRGRGCPYCAGRKAFAGETDLKTRYPDLAKEWSRKNRIRPEAVTPGMRRKVLWNCPNGHEYSAPIVMRTGQGTGCPYCSGKRVLAGFNDLATLRPDLVPEWAEDNEIAPGEVTVGSSRRVAWVCPRGHRYYAKVFSRTQCNAGCPVCAQARMVSMPEFIIAWYLRGVDDVVKQQMRFESSYSKKKFWLADIVLMTHKIVLEYDGAFFHRHRMKDDYMKARDIQRAGYRVIHIREQSLCPVKGCKNILISDTRVADNYIGLETPLKTVLEQLSAWGVNVSQIDVNIKRDLHTIISEFKELQTGARSMQTSIDELYGDGDESAA